MKKIILILIMSLAVTSASAQTWSEWFRQNKTQKKYLLQQIAALKVYIEYAQKGYKIAKDGLDMIGGFTRGEFDLHGDYFASLEDVNPKIKEYIRIAQIIELQLKIVGDQEALVQMLNRNRLMAEKEVDYVKRVFARLNEDCEHHLDELIAVTSDGKLEMTDDQRMKRIDSLYFDMQDKYTFAKKFGNEAKLLASIRKKENKDVETVRALHGITTQP